MDMRFSGDVCQNQRFSPTRVTDSAQRHAIDQLGVGQFHAGEWVSFGAALPHGVSQLEAESAFYDPRHRLFEDEKHSTPREPRYILYGRGLESRVLMVAFTLRGKRVRVITARPASRRERRIYEKLSGRGYRACRGPHPLRLPMPSRYA